MHIGALARATGRSIHTIRWYERQGLMRDVARDGGGRRVYGAEHVAWLRFLDRLRFTGLSIREMRTYARLAASAGDNLAEQRELLERHRDAVCGRMRELADAVALIEWKIDFYRRWEETGTRPAEGGRPSIDTLRQPRLQSPRSARNQRAPVESP